MSPREKAVEERPKTEQERTDEALLETLAELGGKRSVKDNLTFRGKELILPESMDVDGAIDYLQMWRESQEAEQVYTKKFNFRPWDGAHALHSALTKVFGMTGLQKPVWTFFGPITPEQERISVPTGVGRSVNVPWGGNLTVPLFQGTMNITSWKHKELGMLFRLDIIAPKKYQEQVEGLFAVVEEELKNNSIYKGKAIDGQEEAEFIDLSGVERSKVVYSDEVETQLEANVWSLIRFTDMQRTLGLPLKRAILLHGPYGTGKTLAGYLTAQIAGEFGWTCIYCRPVKDDLFKTIQTARLYQPCVVFVEDIDQLASNEASGDPIEMLLDILDGVQAKGTEIMVIVTTNHPEEIHQGVLRPGRLDSMIEISDLDLNGVRRLVQSVVPSKMLSGDMDWDAIYHAMKGYLPAFVKESIDRAIRYAVVRNGGEQPKTLVTDDFVEAATGLRPHWTMMTGAKEGRRRPPLEEALASVTREAIHGTRIGNVDEGPQYATLEIYAGVEDGR